MCGLWQLFAVCANEEENMLPTLTVFTPTYNRAELLRRCYESLRRQTSKDFLWMVIDDGSTDNTETIVEQWIKEETQFEIKYIYKKNGGLHTGYNTAIEHAETELCICIDSDDYMPDNGVEQIITFWHANGSEKYAGIVGLDYDSNGNCIGDPLPQVTHLNLIDLTTGKYPIKNADRKLVVRTDLYKSVAPMPSFPGEKNFNPQYMHIKISLNYDFLVLNECLCHVEYQPDGMSNNMFRQYYNSPNSFAEIRLLDLSLPGTTALFKLKKSIHYCSSCILAKRKHFLWKSPCKFITMLAWIPGVLLSWIIKVKNR